MSMAEERERKKCEGTKGLNKLEVYNGKSCCKKPK